MSWGWFGGLSVMPWRRYHKMPTKFWFGNILERCHYRSWREQNLTARYTVLLERLKVTNTGEISSIFVLFYLFLLGTT
jgi:hypothetical protein